MKNKPIYITGIIALVIMLYILMTPVGALRFAIFRTGYPVSAFTMKLSDNPYKTDIKSNEEIYTLINAPIEEATQGVLENWIVSKHSIFYFGEYYGW